jgi:hypothetical protein
MVYQMSVSLESKLINLNADLSAGNVVSEHALDEQFFVLDSQNFALVMGDRVVLRRTDKSLRLNVRFLGELPGVAITFIFEADGLSLAMFPLGSIVYCEHSSDDKVLLFKGVVTRFDLTYFPILQLSYPASIQSLNAPRDARIDVNRAVLLRNGSSSNVDDMVTAKLKNISQGGGGVASRSAIGFVGDEVDLFMTLPISGKNIKLNIRARVCHIRHLEDADRRPQFFSGLQFMDIPSVDLLYIKSYLFDNLS